MALSEEIIELMTGGPEVRSAMVTITPEIAAELLLKNKCNRKLKPENINSIAGDMLDDNWHEGAGAMSLDKDGNLLDGQHRCLGCIKAGVSFRTTLQVNVDRRAQLAMDTGSRRSLADNLGMGENPEANAISLAAGIAKAYAWERSGLIRPLRPTHNEALLYLEKNPSLREAVIRGNKTRRFIKIPRSVCAAVYHQTAMIDDAETEAFVEKLITGENLEAGDPILALRNWVYNLRGKTTSNMYHAVLVKTWSAWATGRPLNVLGWRRGGTNKEDFPELLDFDGAPWRIRSEIES